MFSAWDPQKHVRFCYFGPLSPPWTSYWCLLATFGARLHPIVVLWVIVRSFGTSHWAPLGSLVPFAGPSKTCVFLDVLSSWAHLPPNLVPLDSVWPPARSYWMPLGLPLRPLGQPVGLYCDPFGRLLDAIQPFWPPILPIGFCWACLGIQLGSIVLLCRTF